MPEIKLLEKNVAELIAAGEVIERPASVIKELAENSIDAGAKHITIEIKNGGISYMRITDDGCGIEYSQLPTAFLRHATSKLRTGEDLYSISTMGFRGEALASVAAVGRVEMLSRSDNQEMGGRYVIEGGEQKLWEQCGCPAGTTIVIRDLFFNTPARLKFLKKDTSEGNFIAAAVDRLALSHPEISFRLIRDNKSVRLTYGDGSQLAAIKAVYGRQTADTLIPVDYSYSGIEVKGHISSPLFCRQSRNMQVFFVNGRYIKSTTCMAAAEEAYRNSIMTGKYPACILSITLPADKVDVNVHPAKTEVKFSAEKQVFDAVYLAAKNALLGHADDKREIKLKTAQSTAKQSKESFKAEYYSNAPEIIPLYQQSLAAKQPNENKRDISQSYGEVPKPKVYSLHSPPRDKYHLDGSEQLEQEQPEKVTPKEVDYSKSGIGADIAKEAEEKNPLKGIVAKEVDYTKRSKKKPGEEVPLEEVLAGADYGDNSADNIPGKISYGGSPGDRTSGGVSYGSPADNTPGAPDYGAYNAGYESELPPEYQNGSYTAMPAYLSRKAALVSADEEDFPGEPSQSISDIRKAYQPELSVIAPEQENADDIRVIGEFLKTYIICEAGEQLVLIDKHAAHERIRFEQLKSEFSTSSQLLMDITEMTVSAEEYDALSEYYYSVEQTGVELVFCGDNLIRITAVPSVIKCTPQELVSQIAECLTRHSTDGAEAVFDDMLHTMACKSAIKAHDNTDIAELSVLAKRVWQDKAIRFCPHGRPVMTVLKKSEIERFFNRIV